MEFINRLCYLMDTNNHKENMKKIIYYLIGLVVLAGIVFIIMSPGKPGKFDSFAQCIKDKGAKFYGAFWCPHCQAQKARFGRSAKYLPYIECSTPDSKSQLPICKDSGITTYPTWDFVPITGTTTERLTGEIELWKLAELTSCKLPE